MKSNLLQKGLAGLLTTAMAERRFVSYSTRSRYSKLGSTSGAADWFWHKRDH